MIRINWEQFKDFKQGRQTPEGMDNFHMLLEFIRLFYNIGNVHDIYDVLVEDELSVQMLQKRSIGSYEEFEDFFYKTYYR